MYDRVKAEVNRVTKASGVLMGVGMMIAAASAVSAQAPQPVRHWAIVVHGGAGVIERSKLGPEGDTAYRAGLKQALEAGTEVLDKAGPGADAFAARVGLEQQPASFFFTESRWQALIKQLTKEGKPIPPRPEGVPPSGPVVPVAQVDESADAHTYGTVGVVALDRQGNVAAGTSTGGMQAKMPGRVGDSPIIGAGTYASNQSCAVSGTGTGEYYIRLGVAREICNLVYFKGMKLQEAADQVIHHELEALHGDGGIIAITPDGQQAWSFNTP